MQGPCQRLLSTLKFLQISQTIQNHGDGENSLLVTRRQFQGFHIMVVLSGHEILDYFSNLYVWKLRTAGTLEGHLFWNC